MTVIVKQASIPAAADDVWATLADFAGISRWAPNVDHSCLMSEQIEGVGMVRRIQSGRMTVLETVTAYEPGAALGYVISGLPPAIDSVTNTWSLDAAGDRTNVALTTEIIPGPRPPHRAVARVVAKALGDASDQMLDGLAAHLTSHLASGTAS